MTAGGESRQHAEVTHPDAFWLSDPFVDALKALKDFRWGNLARASFDTSSGCLRLDIEWSSYTPDASPLAGFPARLGVAQ